MTGVPNTFMTFNIYVDRAMEMLTDSELRILLYADRHIMGWRDKVDDRQGYLSISMFQKGYVTKDGSRYGGCGLGRQTIIDAIASLVKYGFLKRDEKPTAKGQKFTLCTDGIDWDNLETRYQEWQEKAKARTAKATAKRVNGTSDDTGTLDVTMQGTSDVTMLSTLDVTQTNTYSKPQSKTKNRAPSKKNSNTPMNQMRERLQPHTVLAAALLELFDPGYRQSMHTPYEYLITLVQLDKYVPICEDLAALKATPEEIKAVHTYLKPGYTKNGWTIGLKTIVEKLPAFRVWRDNGGETKIITGVWANNPAPELPNPGLTAEERAALVASTKKAVNS